MLQVFLRPSLNVESVSGDQGEDQGSGKMLWVLLAIADLEDSTASYDGIMICPPGQQES